MKAIKTEHLTKFYGKSRGISDVGLSVNEGDFFGFVGPNGAGKSTTIRLLLGLISPTEGNAQVLGKNILKQRTEVLDEVGYLPSETMFYNGMRVRDILSLSAKLRKADCAKEAKILCEALELDPSRRVDELSLGNRKKVGIVCALQHKPRLYILDEPTSGLDPLMQREFYKLLTERNREGATVFLSSHNLSEVDRYCTHAAVIKNGEILVSDSIQKLGHTGVKKVSLHGAGQMTEISGAKNLKFENGNVSFLYSGNPKDLLSQLSKTDFEDFTVTDPELEEVFMHYYTKEEE